jgi:serine/threonine protein kinase
MMRHVDEAEWIETLANYDEVLARGDDPTCAGGWTTNWSRAMTTRFERARSCLELMAAVWPRGPSRSGVEGSHVSSSATAATAASEPELPIGDFGRFRLLKVLGEGGMGVVYKAMHTQLNRLVAIKVIAPHLTLDPDAVARFRREVSATGSVDHPHLVHALDADELDGKHFLVMEYIDGRDLTELVGAHGPLSVADASEIARQAALGLNHAHNTGLIHRDVKPGNLMLSREGCVKVLDLGLALLRKEFAHLTDLTPFGRLMGTADFTSPEQILDPHKVDERTDLYSLGCTLYFLLTGHGPFAGKQFDSPGKKMLAHATLAPPPLGRRRSDAPEALLAVLDHMLAKNPAARFATAAAVADALAPLAVGCDLSALAQA